MRRRWRWRRLDGLGGGFGGADGKRERGRRTEEEELALKLPEESSPARMENRQNTGLKKRKLLRTVREQEPAIKEMCQALKEMESKVKNLRDDNNRLRGELLDKDRQLAVTRTLLVDRERQLTKTQTLLADREQQLEARTLLVDTKEFETEILRLKHLLAEKNDTNNYAALVSPETITEVIQKQTPVSPARTPVSNRTNTVQSSVNAIVHHGSFQDEAREDCCRRGVRTSG
ncbi:uncharacterized protein LOC125543698 isoform X3 [Triticum urartu]|uniref:uncharacterized protein LOC125543698 isoform X3 n=1 Tax=Triticum urartu TaxID=4572 RepID=UPI0020445182|nr:uncharacterized protein LOC125543698 isoform X3 [Triticum urartu]